MNSVLQRSKFTTTLSDKTKDKLEFIREKEGFSSINMVIEYLAMNYESDQRVDKLIGLYEETHTYIKSIAEAIKKRASRVEQSKNKETPKKNTYERSTAEGKCQFPGCRYVGMVTKGNYREWVQETGEFATTELFMCPEHLKKSI